MKTFPLTVVITLAAVLGRIQTSDLPHPWLSLDRSAKVLRLLCQPPPEAHESDSSWEAIHSLRLLAILPQYNSSGNFSLVNMTSNLKEPQTNSMFSISQASFLSPGTWVSKCVSLKFELPVTVRELGQYFCVVGYWDNNDDPQWFSVRVDVNTNFVFSSVTTPKKEQNFEVSVVDAHKVHVTWTNPQQSRFKEARVSRKLVGDDGESITPSMSLFTTNGKGDLPYHFQVLLENFTHQDGDSNNMSITLYVKSDPHGPHYCYSCWVFYPACKGQDRLSCSCRRQQSDDPDRQKCSLQTPQDSENYQTGFHVFLSISLVFFLLFSFCMVVFALFKCNKCQENAWLKKIFKPKRTSETVEESDNQRNPSTIQSALPHRDETGPNTGNVQNQRAAIGSTNSGTENTTSNSDNDVNDFQELRGRNVSSNDYMELSNLIPVDCGVQETPND
ncbi:hypothetical protein ACOMHN_054652 [Nucella lapillus]